MLKVRHMRKESKGSTLGLCTVPKESHPFSLQNKSLVMGEHSQSIDSKDVRKERHVTLSKHQGVFEKL